MLTFVEYKEILKKTTLKNVACCYQVKSYRENIKKQPKTHLLWVVLVEGDGFEPSKSTDGRFTVCSL